MDNRSRIMGLTDRRYDRKAAERPGPILIFACGMDDLASAPLRARGVFSFHGKDLKDSFSRVRCLDAWIDKGGAPRDQGAPHCDQTMGPAQGCATKEVSGCRVLGHGLTKVFMRSTHKRVLS